jgi:hypothetical protein
LRTAPRRAGREWPQCATDHLQTLPSLAPSLVQGYTGHNIPCYTSIREPIDRLVSLYYYIMDKRLLPVTVLLQDMSVSEVLAALSDIWPVMRQTPLLSHFGTWYLGRPPCVAPCKRSPQVV